MAIKEIDYRSELIDFKNTINFENSGMYLYPYTTTIAGTRIWKVGVNGHTNHKFSMYFDKKNHTIEFRYCGIDSNIVDKDSSRVGVVSKEDFLCDPKVAYDILSDLFEELA